MKFLQDMHVGEMNKPIYFQVKMLHCFRETSHRHIHPFLDFIDIRESDLAQMFCGDELP